MNYGFNFVENDMLFRVRVRELELMLLEGLCAYEIKPPKQTTNALLQTYDV